MNKQLKNKLNKTLQRLLDVAGILFWVYLIPTISLMAMRGVSSIGLNPIIVHILLYVLILFTGLGMFPYLFALRELLKNDRRKN